MRVFQPAAATWAVALEGRIDSAVARALEEAVEGLFAAHHFHVLIDFSKATYLASAGIRVLILMQRRAQANAGQVQLVGVPGPILEVMQMAGLEQLFVFYPTLAEALAPRPSF